MGAIAAGAAEEEQKGQQAKLRQSKSLRYKSKEFQDDDEKEARRKMMLEYDGEEFLSESISSSDNNKADGEEQLIQPRSKETTESQQLLRHVHSKQKDP